MEINSVRALRGPSVWGQETVLEVVADFKRYSGITPAQLAQFHELIGQNLPAAANPRITASPEGKGSVPSVLSLAEALLRATLTLQQHSGAEVRFGRVFETPETGVFQLAIQYRDESIGRKAVQFAHEICKAALEGRPVESTQHLTALRSLDQEIRLGPSTRAIVRAAINRGIPHRRLNEHSLVQLGYGCKMRRILAAETDCTGAIAESISRDKELTKSMLRVVGVPVSDGRVVTSAEDAWAAATEIGVPVVIKPKYGNQRRRVALNLNTAEEVHAAFAVASEDDETVVCEKFAPGHDYRLLVINGKLVAAVRRDPPKVIGNGRQTVRELVEATHKDCDHTDRHWMSLIALHLDEVAITVLAEQGLTPDAFPAAGQTVLLRRHGSMKTGGSATDVTDLVHPEVAARAVDGVRMIGLNIAGVDVVATDISRPLEEQGGVVIEVNSTPGLRMHLEPTVGKTRPVGEAIVETMFKPGDDGRVPIAAVTGTNGKTTTTRLIAHILRTFNKCVGMTCTDGIYLNDRRIDTGDCSGPRSARNILSNPSVEAAVLETARGGILREGLGFDRADVAVVTNICEGDHLGLNGIHTVEQLARVKRVIVENVGPTGHAVLNAADPLTAAMSEYCPGKVVYFARASNHPVLVAHRNRGGKVVFVENNFLTAAEGNWEVKVVSLQSVPLTFGGQIGFQVENVLAATAAGWVLGVPVETLRRALESFVSNFDKAPARFNVVQFRGATVVIDYGHNASALMALLEAFEQIPHQRRLINYTATGDRRDEDIIRQAELIGNGFDEIVVFEDKCTRGRADGEVCQLLRTGLARGRRISRIRETRGEIPAIEMILNDLKAGDLALVQIDRVDEVLPFVNRYLGLIP